MKKSLLSFVLSLGALAGFSQVVVFDVLTPPEIAGNYPIEYAPAGAAGWSSVPDLTLPENSVTGSVAIGRDGTEADSLGCEALINPGEVDGKIALIWRGACDFAVKAGNAFDAGAIAVMIVNNVEGAAPVVPGGGTSGMGEPVDVPVAMTSYEAGLALIPHVNAGTATAFIGAVTFENDLTLTPGMVLRSQGAVIPAAIAQNASEFSVPMGSYIANSGTLTQTGVSLTATVTYEGNELYNETAGNETIEPGDSVFLALPTFSQETYPLGQYDVIYSLTADDEDEFPMDNAPYNAGFTISQDIFAYSPWNPETETVFSTSGYRPGTFNASFEPCIYFSDPNASRLKILGLSFAASTDATTTLDGKFLEITAYSWEDEFVDINDDFTVDELIDFDYGIYDYIEDAQQEVVYQPFDNQATLEDDVRYLFCVKSTYPELFLYYAPTSVDYTTAQANYLQPSFPLMSGDDFFLNGFGTDLVPAITLHVEDLTIGVNDLKQVDITPYPNPTMDYIAIPYNGTAASANMLIYDNAGKLVKSTNVNFAGNNMIQVNMAGVPNGNYVFNMQFTDGTTSTFKVVVAR